MVSINSNDVILVKKYINDNDKKAFGEIYSRYMPIVYKYLYARLGKKEIVEDITSETFTTLIEIIDKYDFKAKLSTFIIGIAINKMRQFIQKNSHIEIEFIDNYEIEEIDDESNNKSQEKNEEKLNKILSNLENNERKIIQMRFLESYSVKETAQILNLSDENTRVIQFRAIKKLKKLLNIN